MSDYDDKIAKIPDGEDKAKAKEIAERFPVIRGRYLERGYIQDEGRALLIELREAGRELTAIFDKHNI